MKPTPQPRGLTIVEVVMAMAIIAIALLALMSSVISSMSLVEVNRQESLAMNAARQKFAEMQSTPLGSCFATFKNTAFDVPGIATANAGRIYFPMSASGNLDETVTTVSNFHASTPPSIQTISDFKLATTTSGVPANPLLAYAGRYVPRDMNLDRDANDTNVNGEYVLLPVKIRIRWESIQGEKDPDDGRVYRFLEFNSIITGYK
jgi:prepilin-type N-terminal cleavage/methylation domain-containing protein